CFQRMPTKKRLPKQKLISWLPLIVWIIAICFLSFSPLDNVKLPNFSASDKLAHFGMYALLVYFLTIPLKGKMNAFSLGVVLAIVFSAFTELVQHYWIKNRFGDEFDFMANVLGIFVAYFFLKKRIKS